MAAVVDNELKIDIRQEEEPSVLSLLPPGYKTIYRNKIAVYYCKEPVFDDDHYGFCGWANGFGVKGWRMTSYDLSEFNSKDKQGQQTGKITAHFTMEMHVRDRKREPVPEED